MVITFCDLRGCDGASWCGVGGGRGGGGGGSDPTVRCSIRRRPSMMEVSTGIVNRLTSPRLMRLFASKRLRQIGFKKCGEKKSSGDDNYVKRKVKVFQISIRGYLPTYIPAAESMTGH